MKKPSHLPGEELQRRIKKLRNRLFLPAFLRTMKRLRIGGISGGNRLELITDGDECFDAYLKSIAGAKKSINLESYTFKSDEVGWKIARVLARKARSGCEVNVIYDAVGCIGTSPALFAFLRDSGVEVIEYHPLWPWRKFWNVSLRDHRKLLVVDGRIAFVGGINIGVEYAGPRYNGGRWRDTHLKIEGPAVRDIQFFFIENWYRNGGAIMDNSTHFPQIKEAGKKLLMVLCTRSRRNIRPIHESYISAINYAKNSIYIANAYFIPDARIYRALVRAVRRGVDVRVLLPGISDVPIVQHAGRYLYKRYLRHGIRVYEYGRSVLHAKTAVIDGIWSTVGSSNIDRRSFVHNLEINAVALDQEFGEEMERVFANDLRQSEELTLEGWHKRSMGNFLLEWFWYRFRNLL
ncbi:MAG: cardiolipin synthase [Spirochaetes bacterium]|nr:MAG: cardiolipin synthase [Spirochaetota bacterium]